MHAVRISLVVFETFFPLFFIPFSFLGKIKVHASERERRGPSDAVNWVWYHLIAANARSDIAALFTAPVLYTATQYHR